MPTPLETVGTFLDLWDRPGGLAQAIRDFFTPDAVWENHGFVTSKGIEETMGVLSGFGQDADSLIMRVEVLAIAAQGNKVAVYQSNGLAIYDSSAPVPALVSSATLRGPWRSDRSPSPARPRGHGPRPAGPPPTSGARRARW